MDNMLTIILIAAGALMMGFSVTSTRQILSLLRGSKYQRIWRVLVGFMIFFLIGYIGAIIMVVAGLKDFLIF